MILNNERIRYSYQNINNTPNNGKDNHWDFITYDITYDLNTVDDVTNSNAIIEVRYTGSATEWREITFGLGNTPID